MRHPTEVGDDESARLETIGALVERHTFALQPDKLAIPASRTIVSHGKVYSDQPPIFSLALAGAYWIILKFGNSFRENPVLVPYLLTLVGVTVPVAGAAGLIYRMSRLFELRRICHIWRGVRAGLTRCCAPSESRVLEAAITRFRRRNALWPASST